MYLCSIIGVDMGVGIKIDTNTSRSAIFKYHEPEFQRQMKELGYQGIEE